MARLSKMLSLMWIFISHHPIETLIVNFKLLPFKEAIKLSVFVYTSTEFRSLTGRIIIEGIVHPNMIYIGDNTCYPTTSKPKSV